MLSKGCTKKRQKQIFRVIWAATIGYTKNKGLLKPLFNPRIYCDDIITFYYITGFCNSANINE